MTDQPSSATPKAFLSHASEDKAEFTEPLARELARLGVDPWLDKWEILPGDSLVQKLFDEGLAHADAVVVIVSRFSVTKPWVREELDQGMVRRIQTGTRLIPVRLDSVEVPEPLKHLVWIDAERGAEGVAHAAQRVADTVHGTPRKPAVGVPPTYARSAPTLPGLTTADAFLLVLAVQAALTAGDGRWLDWADIEAKAREGGLTGGNLYESATALAQQHYLDAEFRGGQVTKVSLTAFGYTTAISTVLPDAAEARIRVIARLVNEAPTGERILQDLAEAADAPVLLVREVLNELQARDLLQYREFLGGATRLFTVSPTLSREL